MSPKSDRASAEVSAKLQKALSLQQHGELASAQFIYEKVLKIQPRNFAALNLLGVIAAQTHNAKRALTLFERAIEVEPNNAVAHGNRGLALHELGQFDAALESYARALAIKPDKADTLVNRANVLKDLERWDAALADYDRAIAINPDYAAAYSNSGFVLKELDRLAAALARYDRAIAIKPDYVGAHCNRAFTRLLAGDFENGWIDYEWRRRLDKGDRFAQPSWSGKESIAGKTILLHSEQGLGDTLMFCRYAKLVASSGAQIILEVQRPLVSLLSGLTGVSKIIAKGGSLPPFDCHCPLMSLPLAFKTRADTIPFPTNYLTAVKDKVAHWRGRLGERTKPRVGLVWSGSATNYNDRNRSVQLADLLAYLPADFQYVCLQKDIREPDELTLTMHPEILNFVIEQDDFSDAAALCECMDVVISVDTSIAHLSGALGVETWVLLPATADWRWLLDRSDSPWYSSVKLYRQDKTRDWKGVFARIKLDLIDRAAGSQTS